MKLGLSEFAPFLSQKEQLALSDSGLPFDAVALYIRVFCYLDTGSGKSIAVTGKVMSQLNGKTSNSIIKPLRKARLRTLIKHLERVGLIDRPVVTLPSCKPTFSRSYSRLLTDGLTSITAFEYSKLVDLSLSYEALTLYVRGIRPNLDIHTFKAVVSIDITTEALTFMPVIGSSERYINGSKYNKAALKELVGIGLIDFYKDGSFYYLTCHVSNAFDSNWLKNLSKTT